MRFESGEKALNALEEAIVDYTLVFQCLDLQLAHLTLLMDLVLLCTDEGALVDVRVDFDVRVVAELESVLVGSALC